MPTLTDLQQAAQGGSTLGGIKSNTGVAPSNAQTASSLGASSNAAQMAGTPAQQAAAIKESVSTKSTLDYLKRTETGRVQAKEGQSTAALEKVEAAKQLAGLGGKVAAATQAAVSASTNLPLTVTANLDTYVSDDPALKASLPTDMKVLQDAISSKDGNAQLQAWKNIKSKYNLTTDAVAKMFNVPPETLWSQLESSLTGTKVTLKDLAGVVDPAQIDAAKQLLPAMESTALDNMTWQEAKALINQTLNNATANTVDLQKQASDQTLPASTRAMAVQRLRELGVSGEYQAAGAIQQEQGKLEAADNVRIGDKEYEVQDVLSSPEAKDAIINVLNGTAELKDLEGGPLAGLIPLIKNHADELASKFGIGEDGKLGVGNLQQIEITRSTNEKGITDKLTALGLPVPNKDDKEVLKSLGITDDVLNGYAAFDAKVLENNPTLTLIKGLDAAEQAGAWATLGKPGMAALLDGTHPSLINLLATKDGQTTLANLSKANSFLGVDLYKDDQNTKEELKSMLTDVGLGSLVDQPGMESLFNLNFNELGVEIPAGLDTNNDGIVQPAELQQNLMTAGTLEERNAILANLKNNLAPNLNKARKIQTDDDAIRSAKGITGTLDKNNVVKLLPSISGAGGALTNMLGSHFWFGKDGTLQLRPGNGFTRGEATARVAMGSNQADIALANREANISNVTNAITELKDGLKTSSPKLQAELMQQISVLQQGLNSATQELNRDKAIRAEIKGAAAIEADKKAKVDTADKYWKQQLVLPLALRDTRPLYPAPSWVKTYGRG